jgi:hypothetical protein
MAATAAMPIAAQAQEPDARAAARAERNAERYRQLGERNEARSERREQRQEVRQERQEVRQERQEVRQERQEVRQERQERAAPVQQQSQSWSGRRGEGERGERFGAGRNESNREAYRRRVEETRAANRQSIEESIGGRYERQGLRNQQRTEEQLRREYGIGQRDGRRDWDRDRRDGRDGRWSGRDGRDGRDGRWGDNRGSRRNNWNHSWRNDSRYDWQRYRYSNRNLYRSGSYYAPYRNYRYNRLSIGIVLDSLFYSNRYWLSDPWQYRLPPAPYGTQWVRYYDDVVLVDTYTGEVLDVIENFFW